MNRGVFSAVTPLSNNSFPMLLIHSALLLYSLRCHILHQNCFFPCHPIVGMFSLFSFYLLMEFLSLFWNVLLCLYSFILIFLILLFSPSPSLKPITFRFSVTFMFHSFFQYPSQVQVNILIFAFFQFHLVVIRGSKVHNSASFFFLLIIIMSSFLVEIR